MGRPPRIEIPGAYYHVHTRGNDGQAIYFGNWSGRLFVRELVRTSRRHGWRILAYCLMPNHYHLVLQINDAGLSDGMCELNGRFASISNWVNKRRSHLFGGRFKSHLIEDERYLMAATRYVLLNPYRKSGNDPRNWRWSSMRATMGLVLPPSCVDVGWILSHFGANPARARKAFGEFVDEGRPVRLVPGTDPGWELFTRRG
jgi:putative transposase